MVTVLPQCPSCVSFLLFYLTVVPILVFYGLFSGNGNDNSPGRPGRVTKPDNSICRGRVPRHGAHLHWPPPKRWWRCDRGAHRQF